MSALSEHLDRYLTLRRAMGYRLVEHGRLLAGFVAHLDASGETVVTVEAAVSWAAPPTTSAARASRRLSMIRGFASYLTAFEARTEVPPANCFGATHRRQIPYWYSAAEIDALMTAARCLPNALPAATFETVIGLMAATGIRPSEARGLDRGDIDFEHDELTVTANKLNKTRLLPIHPSVTAALHHYRVVRDRACPGPSTPAFFVTAAGTRIDGHHLAVPFRQLCDDSGITAGPGRRAPRLYDLRHTFAVNTLLDWHADDVDTAARLPTLSTYMGHLKPSATYWYLQAAPELMAIVAARLERSDRDPR